MVNFFNYVTIQSLISQNLRFYSMWRIRQITLCKDMFMNASIHHISLIKLLGSEQLLNYLSAFMIPFVLFYIIGYAVLSKRPVFEDFVEGGKRGFQIIAEIAPTIVGLIVAIGVLRTSGALTLIAEVCKPLAEWMHIPAEIIPLSIIKMFSASGANGLLFDLFKEFGTDSYIGMSASILLSCTETLFYTVSVYFMSVGITKSRWTIPVGIMIAVVSLMVSVWIANIVV